MRRLHFLTALSDKIAKDFLLPIVLNKRKLREKGFDIRIFYQMEKNLLDCDTLCVVSSFVRKNNNNPANLERLKEWTRKAKECYFFDANDSTGAFYCDFLPLVSRYYKKQLLRDRKLYTQNLYSRRYVFDYYHNRFGIDDSKILSGINVMDLEDLKKLRLSWNLGMGDYFPYPKIYRRFGYKLPFWFPDQEKNRFIPATKERTVDVLACFDGYQKSVETIRFHRGQTLKVVQGLPAKVKTFFGFKSFRSYHKCLQDAKIMVSPFGFGEISWKDFEGFINGMLVLKPNMNFMETWPNFYQENETYVTYDWDFKNLEGIIESLLIDSNRRNEIAEKGQQFYLDTVNEKGKKAFCNHFTEIMN